MSVPDGLSRRQMLLKIATAVQRRRGRDPRHTDRALSPLSRHRGAKARL